MYTKDKSNRITLRLNDEQFNYVKSNSDVLGVSPSEFLRMVVNLSMSVGKKTEEKLQEKLGGQGRENDKANINDIV
jgi:negative regulator of replication initiation